MPQHGFPTSNERENLIHAIISHPELDENEKSRLVESFIHQIRTEYPDLKHHATRQDVTETELRLTKEIDEVRLKIEQVRADLTKEIEQVRADLTKEIEQIRADLTKEIERLRAETQAQFGQTHSEIEHVRADVIKWSFLFWASQMGVLLALLWRLTATG